MARLQKDLAAVFGASITSHAQWAVVVRSPASGETLYELNAGKMMMPASNMKIVTLAAAAEILGWDYRFTTSLETAGWIDNGVLHGDLTVIGGGDPTIGARDDRAAAVFDEWASALRSAGISRIDGRIVGDDDLFDEEGLGAGWSWDDLQYGYAAPVGALQYNENVAELTVYPGASVGEPAAVALPPGAGLTVANRALTAGAETPETVEYRRRLDGSILEIDGVVPMQPPPAPGLPPVRRVPRQVAVVNPTRYFVHSLRDALIARGIQIAGEALDIDELLGPSSGPASTRRVLAQTESPPLRDIAGVLMKVSQNMYAETLLKACGIATGGPGTTEAGRNAVLGVLRAWNIDPAALVMADGSGLSRYNYVTADLLAKILERMYTDPRHRDAFLASLPVAGRDGTMSLRMRGTPAEGNAQAKTGSISNVRTLSGYVRSKDGEVLVFSILANDFVLPSATVNWITDLAVEILANFSRH